MNIKKKSGIVENKLFIVLADIEGWIIEENSW